MYADQALKIFMDKLPAGARVLDIGPGEGEHSQHLATQGFIVETLGPQPNTDYPYLMEHGIGQDLPYNFFDGVWCSHVFEHSPCPRTFLLACRYTLKMGGVFALTVPPSKPYLVGGHVSIWNPGLLLYHLILAGFDCQDAMVGSYGYNISVVLHKLHEIGLTKDLAKLNHDAGDVNLLLDWFPKGTDITEGCNTIGLSHNWRVPS